MRTFFCSTGCGCNARFVSSRFRTQEKGNGRSEAAHEQRKQSKR